MIENDLFEALLKVSALPVLLYLAAAVCAKPPRYQLSWDLVKIIAVCYGLISIFRSMAHRSWS